MKIGIVGTNFISDWFCEAGGEVSGVEITAVYSRAEETGAALADRWGIGSVYTDYEAMLKSDIDAVYIASPTFMHESQAIRAMERGKHVLCEKMMAASYPGAVRMVNAARENGVVLLEAMRPDFDPATDAIISGIKEIGRIRRAHLEYCQYSSRYDSFKRGEVLNAFRPELCNSALADIGIYPLHMALRLFGTPREHIARSVLLGNGFEGQGNILLCYEDMLCDVVYSKITEGKGPSVIEGEEGSVAFDRINAPNIITLEKRGGTAQLLPFEKHEKNMSCEIAAFRDMVDGRADNRRYMDVTLEAIRIAHESFVMTGAIAYMDPKYMK